VLAGEIAGSILVRKNALPNVKLLKEKPRRNLQLLSGFKKELAGHTPFALFVSLNFHWVDAQPGSQLLLLGEPTRAPSPRNVFANLCSQRPVEGRR
jgi:hypothetical protein